MSDNSVEVQIVAQNKTEGAFKEASEGVTELGGKVAGMAEMFENSTSRIVAAIHEQTAALIEGLGQMEDEVKEHAEHMGNVWARMFEGLSHPFKEENWKEFSEALGEAISHPLKTVGEGVKNLMLELGPLGASALGAAAGMYEVGKEAYELVNEEGLAARQTQNFATMLNLSYEETKKLGMMAKIVDTDISSLAVASMRLSSALSGTGNRRAEEALKKLGVTATEGGEALAQMLQKLADMPDKTARSAAAFEILNRSGYRLMPLIENFDRLKKVVEELDRGVDPHGLIDAHEKVNELGIAWGELKELLAEKLAPTVEVAVKIVTKALGPGASLEEQIASIKSQIAEAGTMALPGDPTMAATSSTMGNGGRNTESLKASLATLEKQKEIEDSRREGFKRSEEYDKEITAGYAASAERWKEANAHTLTQMERALSDAKRQITESSAKLGQAIAPTERTEELEKLKKAQADELRLQNEIKAAEKVKSGANVAERNSQEERRVEQRKKQALLELDIERDAAKRQFDLTHSSGEQDTQALLGFEDRHYEIEKKAAEDRERLQAETARAERKPAPAGSDMESLRLEHVKNRNNITAKGSEDDRKLQEAADKLDIERQLKANLHSLDLERAALEEQLKLKQLSRAREAEATGQITQDELNAKIAAKEKEMELVGDRNPTESKKLRNDIADLNEQKALAAQKTTAAVHEALNEEDKTRRQFDDRALSADIAHNQRMLAAKRDALQEQVKLGRITAAQELQQLEAIEQKEFALQERLAQTRLANSLGGGNQGRAAAADFSNAVAGGDRGNIDAARSAGFDTAKSAGMDPKEAEAAFSEIEKLYDQHTLAMQKSTDAMALQMHQSFQKLMDPLVEGFGNAVVSLTSGTVRVSQAFTKMGQSIVREWATSMMQVVEKHIMSLGIMRTAEEVFNKVLIALHLESAAESALIAKTTAAPQIAASAGIAGAAAAAAAAATPIIGPAEAVPAGLAVSSTVMAIFSSLASASGGWDLPAGGPFPTMLHSREMVLPEEHADTLRSMKGGGGAQGGNVTNHIYQGGRGESPNSIQSNMDAFTRGFRDGRFRLAHA